jgi:hypothetical protein
MKTIPECPNYIAHPQSVWFHEHWLPIIKNQNEEIKRLQQIVTEPGEGNRYRLLMNDNQKLTSDMRLAISILREKDKSIINLKDENDRLTRQNNYWEIREMEKASCCYHNETQNEKLKAALIKSNEMLKGAGTLADLVKENDKLINNDFKET